MTLPTDYIQNYDQIAQKHVAYARTHNGHNPFMEPALVETLEQATEQIVRRYVTPGLRILDAGCGPGTLLARLDGYDRWGADLSSDYLDYARETGLVNGPTVSLFQHDLQTPLPPFWDNHFDAVICADVLEHVLRPDQVIDELKRVLRPGGHLIIRVPQETDLAPYLDADYTYIHLRKYDDPSLRLWLGKVHQLDVVEVSPVDYPGWNELHAVCQKP